MLRVLEVALGLALVFSLVSFAVSLVTEWISAIWGRRGALLRRGVEQMLGKAQAGELYDHPLFQSLMPHRWLASRHGPSYVPTDLFVTTLLSQLDPEGKGAGFKDELLTQLDDLPEDDELRRALLPLVTQAEDDWEKVKKSVGDWFDQVMEGVTAWYRRWSQLVLFLTGFVLAMVVGVDALDITRTLWINDEIRAGVARVAEEFSESGIAGNAENGEGPTTDLEAARRKAKELQELQQDLAAVGLRFRPITGCGWEPDLPWCLLGYLLTAFAASLGAPFWFDLLKKLVQIRTTALRPTATPEPTPSQPPGGGSK